MKKAHIINIGYPKCGTTWCWESLRKQHWFDAPREKENNDLLVGTPMIDYINAYSKYDITANFSPALVHVDRYLIKQLSEIPTVQISIILRNIFDIFYSHYTFLLSQSVADNLPCSYNQYTQNIIDQGWFHRASHLIQRWQKYFQPERFHVFYYSQIQKDNAQFFKQYCKQLKLPTPNDVENKIVNKTQYTNNAPILDQSLVKVINHEIDNLQILLGNDLSAWKK
jgi:hypothetical protein